MVVGKVDGIMHAATTHDTYGGRDHIGQLQRGDFGDRNRRYLIGTDEENGLVWFHLKRCYHKTALTIQFCTRSQLHRFPFCLQNQCHLRLMRQPVYSESWHYLLGVIT